MSDADDRMAARHAEASARIGRLATGIDEQALACGVHDITELVDACALTVAKAMHSSAVDQGGAVGAVGLVAQFVTSLEDALEFLASNNPKGPQH